MGRALSIFCHHSGGKKKKYGESQKGHGTNMGLEIRISGFCFQFHSFLLWKCNSRNYWTSSELVSAEWEKIYHHLSQHRQIHPILIMQIVGGMIPSVSSTDFGNESAPKLPCFTSVPLYLFHSSYYAGDTVGSKWRGFKITNNVGIF